MVAEARALGKAMRQRALVTAVFEACDSETVGLLDKDQVAAALKRLGVSVSSVRMRAAVRKAKRPTSDKLFGKPSPFPSHLTLVEFVHVLSMVDLGGGWEHVRVGDDFEQLVGGLQLRSMTVGGGSKGVEPGEGRKAVRFEEEGVSEGDGGESSECVFRVVCFPKKCLSTAFASQVRCLVRFILVRGRQR